jgi:hypothetical protein
LEKPLNRQLQHQSAANKSRNIFKQSTFSHTNCRILRTMF